MILGDTSASHAPTGWSNTTAGYLMKTNNENPNSTNISFVLMIFRSSTNAFATRAWHNKAWGNWAIGGTGGGSSTAVSDTQVEDYGIFYWDGKSGVTNTENVKLWQNIYNVAKTKTVLVFASDKTNVSQQKRAVFIINSTNIKTDGTINLNSLMNASEEQTYSTNGSEFSNYYAIAHIEVTSSKVTSVSAISSSDITSKRYLPTNSTAVNSYTPTYDYHPATKKYVDDLDKKNVKSSDGSVKNWITMTKEEFETAKANNTIEDGTVINVLDDFEVGVGNYNTFYWDGLNSSANVNNLYLWKAALQAAEDYGCAAVIVDRTFIEEGYFPVITISERYKTYISNNKLKIRAPLYSVTNSIEGTVAKLTVTYSTVELTFSNEVLTSVSSAGRTNFDTNGFLTTGSLSASKDGQFFTPIKSYHPVSKGYLETQIITTQKTSKTCELPTDIT